MGAKDLAKLAWRLRRRQRRRRFLDGCFFLGCLPAAAVFLWVFPPPPRLFWLCFLLGVCESVLAWGAVYMLATMLVESGER